MFLLHPRRLCVCGIHLLFLTIHLDHRIAEERAIYSWHVHSTSCTLASAETSRYGWPQTRLSHDNFEILHTCPHTYRHSPACAQVHCRQVHRCHPISGEGGKRGARWEALECEILAGTILCLLTPSSCSPQPRSTAQDTTSWSACISPLLSCNTGAQGMQTPSNSTTALCTTQRNIWVLWCQTHHRLHRLPQEQG